MARSVGRTAGLTAADRAGLLEIREDNADEIAEAIASQTAAALETVGLLAEGYAKRKCPVDTGRLRNSITHTVDGAALEAYIGTNVEYAPHVELGTRHQDAQPFLRPAAQDHGSQYRRVISDALSK